jgi:hypothetical protein
MGNITNLIESNIAESSYTLVSTTDYNKLPKSNKLSRMMLEEYKECNNKHWITKASISLMNGILTQNRKVFILTRKTLIDLVDNDCNHKNRVKIDNNQYKLFISTISKSLVSIQKLKRKRNEVMVCTVKNETILSYLTSDLIEQQKQVIGFITGEIYDDTNSINTLSSEQENNILAIHKIVNKFDYFRQNYNPQFNKSFKIVGKLKRINERLLTVFNRNIQ